MFWVEDKSKKKIIKVGLFDVLGIEETARMNGEILQAAVFEKLANSDIIFSVSGWRQYLPKYYQFILRVECDTENEKMVKGIIKKQAKKLFHILWFEGDSE